MTRFFPDTCGCVIDYSDTEKDSDNDPKFIRMVSKCKFHAELEDSKAYKEVLKHNRSFNLKHGSNPTAAQLDEIQSLKQAEKQRIKALN